MLKRSAIALVALLATLWIGALPAYAHTAFESSNPADGAILERPVAEIEITFSGVAEPAGDGFEVLDASGTVRTPNSVGSADGLTWVLTFEPPLPAGPTGVRWSVAAPDAHPIEGSFSFTAAGAPGSDSAGSASARPGEPPTAADDLDAFLQADPVQAPLAGLVGVVGRTVSLTGAILAMGGIAFAALVLRGPERDIRSVIFWVRRAAALLGLGSIIEFVHQVAVRNGDWLTVWPVSTVIEVAWSPLGLAVVLRLVGAALMLRAHLDVVQASRVADPVVAVQSAVGIGAASTQAEPAGRDVGTTRAVADGLYVHDGDGAWRVDGELALVGIGILATLVSYVFDGHTVTEGTRLITAIVGVAHVAAAAVWAGGLVMLVHVIWLRHRRGAETRALQLAVRFSVVAAAALVIAGAAGIALTAIILDRPSDLWTTPWGRILMAKIGVVLVAAAAGGYNHKVLIPHMMRRAPNDPAADAEFRRTVSVEGAAMLLVIVVTALLVGAAS